MPNNNFQLYSVLAELTREKCSKRETLQKAYLHQPASQGRNTCIIDLSPEKWLFITSLVGSAWGEWGTWVIRKIIKAYTVNKSQSITAVIKISCGFFPPLRRHIDLLSPYKKLIAKYFIMMMLLNSVWLNWNISIEAKGQGSSESQYGSVQIVRSNVGPGWGEVGQITMHYNVPRRGLGVKKSDFMTTSYLDAPYALVRFLDVMCGPELTLRLCVKHQAKSVE